MNQFLDFEKSIAELEGKIEELKRLSNSDELNITDEVTRLQTKLQKILGSTYANLKPWQTVQVARHPSRPKGLDYIQALMSDFFPLAGDRAFAEDSAIVGGLARFCDQSVVVLAHEKGNDTNSRLFHNFGMPKPEGYRKARRLMKLADQFGFPLITFVDTAGAYPGIEAEERGQAESIAQCIDTCLSINVPIISIIIGEGGSGGAIAIAVANVVLMLEHAIYSVISPEGCASILWKTASKSQEAAEAQKLTAKDLKELKIIDEIIKEPLGGAHRSFSQTFQNVKETLVKALDKIQGIDAKEERQKKFLAIGR